MGASQPRVVDSVYSLPVADIRMGDRLRPIDHDWAKALGGIIAVEGQRDPIEVCRVPGRTGWMLVAGGHRLAAAKDRGKSHINAIIVTADKVERKMREVSENLWRKNLGPLDRSRFIAEIVELHKFKAGVDPSKDGRSASAQVRWQKALKSDAEDANATIAVAYGWADEVATAIGLSRRTVEYDLLLHRRLSPANISHLRAVNHPILKNAAQLKALAKLDTAKQIEVTDLLRCGAVKTVSEAVSTLDQGQAPTAEAKRLSAFIGAFARMGLTEKKGALAQLAGMLPAGFKLTESASA